MRLSFPLAGTLAPVAVAVALALTPAPAHAGIGDLLVAPTRVILDGRRGAEIILNNIGDDVATYRISLELKRMTADGRLVDVTAPDAKEQAAQAMVLYAPRKVVLPPNQPQSIRVTARPAPGLADGEYRVHLEFRAIPAPTPATADPVKVQGVAFRIIPVYGVTIPVIVRLGNLTATAAVADVQRVDEAGKPTIHLALSRHGSRSVFGEIKILKAGVKEPIARVNGIAVYTELDARSVSIPLDAAAAAQAHGQVTVQYVENTPTGPVTLAETSAMLR